MTLFLIDNDALLNKSDEKRNGVIHYCAKGGHSQLLKLLLDKKPDVTSKNANGKTPLDLAKNLNTKRILDNYLAKTRPKFNRIKIHNITKENKPEKPKLNTKMHSKFGQVGGSKRRFDTKPKETKQEIKVKAVKPSVNKGIKSKDRRLETKSTNKNLLVRRSDPTATKKQGLSRKKPGLKSKPKLSLGMQVQKSHKQFTSLKNKLTSKESKPTFESVKPLTKMGTSAKIRGVKKKKTTGKVANQHIFLADESHNQSKLLNSQFFARRERKQRIYHWKQD